MKRQKANDKEINNDEEIPANILDNLSLDEKILYKSKGIKKLPGTKFFKYIVPILQLAMIIEIFFLFRFIQDDIDFIILTIIFVSIIVWIYWVLLVKFNLFASINYFALTNKAVYVYQNPRKFLYSNKSGTLEKIELSSLTAVLLRKFKKKKNLDTRGMIDFIYPKESPSKPTTYPVNRMAIGETNNVLVECNILESILWLYKDVNKRIDTISEELHLNESPEISPTSQELIRLRRRVKHHNVELVIGSIVSLICVILVTLGDNNISLICIFGIIASFTLIMFIASLDFHIRQVLPSSEGRIQITPEGLKFIHKKGIIIFNFNSTIGFDFKIIPNKIFSEKFILIGAITIQALDNPDLKVKFGPIIEIMKVLEYLYLSYISWKNHHQLLLNEEELLRLRDQKGSKEYMKKVIQSSLFVDNIPSQIFGLSAEQGDNVKEMLALNEKVLTVYQPKRKTFVLLAHLIVFSVGVILVSFSVCRVFELLLVNVFVMVFTFGMVMIIFTLISLYNYTFINTIYIFTDQKLIVKNFKKYHDVPYKDISLILLNEGRKSDVIQIDFKVDSAIKTRAKINNISLPIEKDSDLYDKLISYKLSFT